MIVDVIVGFDVTIRLAQRSSAFCRGAFGMEQANQPEVDLAPGENDMLFKLIAHDVCQHHHQCGAVSSDEVQHYLYISLFVRCVVESLTNGSETLLSLARVHERKRREKLISWVRDQRDRFRHPCSKTHQMSERWGPATSSWDHSHKLAYTAPGLQEMIRISLLIAKMGAGDDPTILDQGSDA